MPAFFNHRMIFGTVAIFVMGAIVAAGGGGGGGIFVPTLILVVGLSPHFAIPLSKVTIFGASIGGYIVNGGERSPVANRPLIYYDIALIMEPPILMGTVLGVYLNVLFPEYILVIMLILVLGQSSWTGMKKAFQLYAKEIKLEREQAISMSEMSQTELPPSLPQHQTEETNNSGIVVEMRDHVVTEMSEEVRLEMEIQQRQKVFISLFSETNPPFFNLNEKTGCRVGGDNARRSKGLSLEEVCDLLFDFPRNVSLGACEGRRYRSECIGSCVWHMAVLAHRSLNCPLLCLHHLSRWKVALKHTRKKSAGGVPIQGG